MKGFMEFARKQGVVGLAIGFIVGAATGVVVSALANDLISPIIAMILGKQGLNALTFTINNAVFSYGHFISVLINLIIILAVVYLVFKVLRLEELDLEEEEEK